jgi:hypothetical protein
MPRMQRTGQRPRTGVSALRCAGHCHNTMSNDLKREEWDFSGLDSKEWLPALFWEARRENTNIEPVIANARAWLAGKLSDRRAPMPKDKRTGKRPRYNNNFSEADIARMRASTLFQEFIPFGESLVISKRESRDSWLASHIRPLIDNSDVPWLCLPESERQRLREISHRIQDTNVVHIGSWCDAVWRFKKQKPPASEPLKYDYSNFTSVLLTINWQCSQKRILAAISKIVRQIKPPGIKHWDRRGKKDRDIFVALERFAIMRLLHHHTLSELKLRLPDAWNLYSHRKWYDERRRALKDFRDLTPYRDAHKYFPKSWETKAHRFRASQLPAK